MALISVITPCFNDGIYLDDAFNSIQINKYSDKFEHIIINDGSTDDFTLRKFNELQRKGAIVIHQDNRGLAEARNSAIKIAKGKYILPLDSDNKIVPEVFLHSVAIMESDENIDVVYTDARYFGEKNEKWIVGSFDGLRLLFGNYIDACALIRKKTLFNIGMYDVNMPAMGNEDWELWLNFFLNNRKVVYLPKIGFQYRVTKNSMSVTTTRPNYEKNRQYLYSKHYKNILPNINQLILNKIELEKKIGSINSIHQNEIDSLNTYYQQHKWKAVLKILLGKRLINIHW